MCVILLVLFPVRCSFPLSPSVGLRIGVLCSTSLVPLLQKELVVQISETTNETRFHDAS